MSFRAALRARLTDWPDLADTAAPIRWSLSGQKDSGPRIVLSVVSQVRPQHLRGLEGHRYTRVQADCFAPTSEAAEVLAEAVIAAVAQPGHFDGVKMVLAEVSGPIDLTEKNADGITHRQTADMAIWHNG